MARTRITISNDTSFPRIITLGSGVLWYIYIRSGNKLCVQREVSGIRDAEVEICSPVTYADAVLSPDSSVGWIYFITDGGLQSVQVTNLAIDPMNAVPFNRQDSWYENLELWGSGFTQTDWSATDRPPIKKLYVEPSKLDNSGFSTIAWEASEGPDTPVLAIEWFVGEPYRTLVVSLPNRSLYRNRNITHVRVFRRLSTSTTFTEYSYEVVGLYDNEITINVPITVTPATYWRATCVRTGYLASESALSNTVADDGNVPPIYLQKVGVDGSGFTTSTWTTTDHPPLKKVFMDNGPILNNGSGFASASWKTNGNETLG